MRVTWSTTNVGLPSTYPVSEFRRHSESEDFVGGPVVGVGRVVEHLGEPDRADVSGDSRQCERQNVIGEAGVDSGTTEQDTTSLPARRSRTMSSSASGTRKLPQTPTSIAINPLLLGCMSVLFGRMEGR
jgi:hypothetical protein